MFRSHLAIPVLVLLLAAPFAASAQPQPFSWVPQGMEALGQRAAFHTDFTFDRSMLELAGNFMGENDQDLRQAIAKLNGISVHSYHFSAPGLYDPAALEAVRTQYRNDGWEHLVAAQDRGDPFNPGRTDLWIHFSHVDVTGMVILVADPKNLNLIAINGDISTLDVLHLRGHFGIPRFEGDHFVPAPGSRVAPRREYSPPPQPQAPAAPDQAPNQAPGEKPSPYAPQ